MPKLRVHAFSVSIDGYAKIDLPALGYECVEHVASTRATHVVIRKRP